MIRRTRARLVVLLIGGVAGACMDGRGAPAPPTGVVVITLDTTRADRLSPYGFMNVSLPALERLAREGVVFDVRDNADSPLAERFTTLADCRIRRTSFTGCRRCDRPAETDSSLPTIGSRAGAAGVPAW